MLIQNLFVPILFLRVIDDHNAHLYWGRPQFCLGSRLGRGGMSAL